METMDETIGEDLKEKALKLAEMNEKEEEMCKEYRRKIGELKEKQNTEYQSIGSQIIHLEKEFAKMQTKFRRDRCLLDVYNNFLDHKDLQTEYVKLKDKLESLEREIAWLKSENGKNTYKYGQLRRLIKTVPKRIKFAELTLKQYKLNENPFSVSSEATTEEVLALFSFYNKVKEL